MLRKKTGRKAGATDEFKGQIFFLRVSAFLLDVAEQPAPPPRGGGGGTKVVKETGT